VSVNTFGRPAGDGATGHRWPTAPGNQPTGISITNQRLSWPPPGAGVWTGAHHLRHGLARYQHGAARPARRQDTRLRRNAT
jgi:hypothetical protein